MKITSKIIAFAAVMVAMTVSLHSQTTNAPSSEAPAKFSGALTAIDTTANTVTVDDKKAQNSVTLSITSATKVARDKKPATLADFQVGDKVEGAYTTDASGVMTATVLHTHAGKKDKGAAKTNPGE